MITKTKTIINIKTDKSLKKSAQKVAEELGIPLSTAINAFLKQFIRDRELILSSDKLRATPYLQSLIEESEKEFKNKKQKKFTTVDEMFKDLEK